MNLVTEKITSEIELAVLKALKPYGDFKKSDDKFSTYDLFGTTSGQKTLIEIKNRSTEYDNWYIEKAKIDRLVALKNKAGYELRIYLCMVVENKAYFYNANEIAKCQVKEVYINNYTNEEFNISKIMPKKSIRKLYCFPKNIYKTKILI